MYIYIYTYIYVYIGAVPLYKAQLATTPADILSSSWGMEKIGAPQPAKPQAHRRYWLNQAAWRPRFCTVEEFGWPSWMVARNGACKIETSENIEMARRALVLSAP